MEHPNDKIYNCKDCKYATNYLPNLNTHASSKHKKKVRQCSLCSYNTTWNTSFLEHMRCAHGLFQKKSKHFVESETHPILCDDCGFSSYNQKQFNAHKLANCQSKPTLQHDANAQMRYNSSLKVKAGCLRCNKCEFKSDKPAEIRDHFETVHADLQLGREDDNKLKY